jgi:hypothetical protein
VVLADAGGRRRPLVQRRIHLIPLSLPGLTRQSILRPVHAFQVDARIESGHDGQGYVLFASMRWVHPAGIQAARSARARVAIALLRSTAAFGGVPVGGNIPKLTFIG